MVKEVSGEEFTVIEADRRAGDPAAVIAVSGKIKRMLGWLPRYNDLRTIVRSAYGWEKRSKSLTVVTALAIPPKISTVMPVHVVSNVIPMEVPVAKEQQLVVAAG
jgi:hypothetical protein